MNCVVLLGNLTKDIELKKTEKGKRYARFSLAVPRRGKDSGTDFVSCLAWENTAEFLQKYCNKGTKIAINGRLQTGQYDDRDR